MDENEMIIKELTARCEALEREIKNLDVDHRKSEAYLKGRVDGLEFSIRCNGVSGAEVIG